MFEIKDVEINSNLANLLNSLLIGEWPHLEYFETERHGIKIPNPIVAIENNTIVGGLSFTSYKKPDSTEIGIWVNTLFVIPSMRKQGIAKQLILASQQYAKNLHALTDIPALYSKVGWEVISTDGNGTVVKYSKNT